MPFYRLRVTVCYVSPARVGSPREMNREEGLVMIREALQVTQDPGEVRDILREKMGWVHMEEDAGTRVEVHVRPITDGLYINLVKLSHSGRLYLNVEAAKLSVEVSLLSFGARAAASQLDSREQVEELGLPKTLLGDVRGLVGDVIFGSEVLTCKDVK
jgi:hypothetical protein